MIEEEALHTAHLQATADELVPPKIQRLIQHLHNMIVLMDMYRFLGMETPEWLKVELVRAEEATKIQIEIENRQGGNFHNFKQKVKQHDETRKSRPLNGHGDEGGTEEPSGIAGRRV